MQLAMSDWNVYSNECADDVIKTDPIEQCRAVVNAASLVEDAEKTVLLQQLDSCEGCVI